MVIFSYFCSMVSEQQTYSQAYIDGVAIEVNGELIQLGELLAAAENERRKEYGLKIAQYEYAVEVYREAYLNQQDQQNDAAFVLNLFQQNALTSQLLTAREKFKIAVRLLKMARKLKKAHNDLALNEFKVLELQLQTGLRDVKFNASPWDFLGIPLDTYIASSDAIYLLKLAKKSIRDKRRIIIAHFKALIRFFKFDLRMRFRSIITILFKNMDDQSGDDHNLFRASSKQHCIIFNPVFHDNKRNHHCFRINRQKRKPY